jgi:hypothetical protein
MLAGIRLSSSYTYLAHEDSLATKAYTQTKAGLEFDWRYDGRAVSAGKTGTRFHNP